MEQTPTQFEVELKALLDKYCETSHIFLLIDPEGVKGMPDQIVMVGNWCPLCVLNSLVALAIMGKIKHHTDNDHINKMRQNKDKN